MRPTSLTIYDNYAPTACYSLWLASGKLNPRTQQTETGNIRFPPRQESGARHVMSDPSLTARYNNPKKRHLTKKGRNWLIGSALGLGVIGAAYLGFSNYDALSYQDLHYDVVSATQTDLSISVEYNTKDRVQCDIRAMNESKAVVGYTTIVMDPGNLTGVIDQTVTTSLHTDNAAVTAGLESCYVVSQEYKG